MRLESLPATINKKYDEKHEDVIAGLAKAGDPMPNIIEITNNVRNKADTKQGEKVIPVVINVPAPRFEYQQYDSYEEFVADCGGLEAALEVINGFKRNAATTAGKVAIRTATNGDVEQMIASGLLVCKNHTFKVDNTLTTKDKAARFDELSALFKSGKLSMEEMAQKFAELGNS